MSLLPQQQTIKQYVADGFEDVYSYKCLVPLDIDLDVYVTPSGQQSNDNTDIQPLNVNYTVQNAGNLSGGTITFLPGYIPGLGSIVTLARNVKAEIDTNYSEARTINGPNLDNSFQRGMLVGQQNEDKINDRSLRYQTSSYIPDSTNKNIVPTLPTGYIWKGSSAGGVVSAFLEENPDSSALRSELESEAQGADGAGIVGYYDENRLLGTTVRDQLNRYGNSEEGTDGASIIGYYDTTTGTQTNVAEILRQLENSLFSPGCLRIKFVPIVDPGWAACDGGSYDMVGSDTNAEIQRLGNTFLSQSLVEVYGIGIDSYRTLNPSDNIITHECESVGVSGAPDPHDSDFVMVITTPGTASVRQVVTVTVNAGNTIPPSSYYELKAPSGRSTVFWFEVDGVGIAPSFPTSLIQKVSILSSDTENQVAQKILEKSFLQYRVPLFNGLTPRDWDNGTGIDPDAALRTDINGNVVGGVIGSIQQDALQQHTHDPLIGTHFANFATSPKYDIGGDNNTGGGATTGNVTNTARTSTETRGKNMYVFTTVKF